MSGVTVDGRERTEASTAAAILSWLSEGGTQQPDGSFAGWKDLRSGLLSPPYPEITGYALGFLASSRAADVAQRRGRSAAEWLSSRILGGDFRARPEKTGEQVYAFDLGMAGHGLLRHGSVGHSRRAVAAGLACTDYLMRLIDEHGSLPPIDPRTMVGPVAPAWSTTGSAHLLKCVQALLSAHAAGERRALAYAEQLVHGELARWCGGLPPRTCPENDVLSLHAVSYAAEGLWIWGTFAQDDSALSRARDLTAWLWKQRLADGGFPGFLTETGRVVSKHRQCDVAAQVLRLTSLYPDLGIDSTGEMHRLTREVWTDGVHAGLLYQPDAEDRHVNSWASMFAYQALVLADPRQTLSWFELV